MCPWKRVKTNDLKALLEQLVVTAKLFGRIEPVC
jgi:hypothetical protein